MGTSAHGRQRVLYDGALHESALCGWKEETQAAGSKRNATPSAGKSCESQSHRQVAKQYVTISPVPGFVSRPVSTFFKSTCLVIYEMRDFKIRCPSIPIDTRHADFTADSDLSTFGKISVHPMPGGICQVSLSACLKPSTDSRCTSVNSGLVSSLTHTSVKGSVFASQRVSVARAGRPYDPHTGPPTPQSESQSAVELEWGCAWRLENIPPRFPSFSPGEPPPQSMLPSC